MVTRRVLLVGGDLTADVLREYFGASHGDAYEVESIEHRDDALTTLLRRSFDLVLLLSLRAPWRTWSWFSLPAQSIGGESAIRFLKQLRVFHNPVPVVLVSVWSSAELEAEALANGAVAVIPKPLKFAELEQVLDALFRPGDQSQ